MGRVGSRALGALGIAGATLGAAPATDPDALLRSLAAAAGQAGEPLIRIGLEAAHRVALSSSTSLRILDPATGAPAWREQFDGEVLVIAEGGPETASVGFRVQVGAYGTEAAARAEAAELGSKLGQEIDVHRDPDRGTWRLRVGRGASRPALGPLVERLRQAGRGEVWIVEDPRGSASRDVVLRLVDASFDSRVLGTRRLAVAPTAGGRVQVEGKPYRGVIELRISPLGMVRAINWVGLEQYLLGVVPLEMGPEAWPELEALRAQAVAARTYAWRNLGQFGEEGYDQCATARCQVYGGAAAEHPLSDRAVLSTRGEILTWASHPIQAYFTSTCGGHTEDVEVVFPGETAPYLRGVACRAEQGARGAPPASIAGRAIGRVVDETGEDVTRAWALLRAAGVVDGPGESATGSPLAPDMLRSWTRVLARRAGRPEPQGPPREVRTLGQAAAAVVEELGWGERARVLVAEADLPALLRDPSSAGLPLDERRALAYLASLGVIRPFPDGSFRAGEPASRARLLPALVRIGEGYDAFELRSAVVGRVDGRVLRLLEGQGERGLRLADEPLVFGWMGGRAVPSSSLLLWPGDRVRFRTDPSGQVDFLELLPPVLGAADDRSSSLFAWEERRTRRQLDQQIGDRVPVGELEDLQVLRRGVSGRVAELRIVGSAGSTVVKGFDVRRVLGLRESLTVIEPQRDEGGRLEAVVFAGRGWGHGVGLCQVGAYGMALRGQSYREILAHYYPGATLARDRGN